jgi:hypothetical protein
MIMDIKNILEAKLCGIKYLIEVSISVVDFCKQINGVKASILSSIIIHANIELEVTITNKVVIINSLIKRGVLALIVSYFLALLA